SMNALRLEIGSDGVALITFDLPDHPDNVFTPEFVAELSQAVEHVLSANEIRGAILSSAKSGFVAGPDLEDLINAFDRGITAVEAAEQYSVENRLLRRMETGGKPFAAAING